MPVEYSAPPACAQSADVPGAAMPGAVEPGAAMPRVAWPVTGAKAPRLGGVAGLALCLALPVSGTGFEGGAWGVIGPAAAMAQTVEAEPDSAPDSGPDSGSDVAPEDQVAALHGALRLDELTELMRAEGIAYGVELAREMLGSAPPSDWTAAVEAIHDPAAMDAVLRRVLEERLAGVDLTQAITFFESEPGASLIGLELQARSAFMEPDIEAAAREAAALAMADRTPRFDLVQRYVEANALIDLNVSSGMNGNYQYFLGMIEGGAMPPELTEDRLLQDLWSQEPDIRASSTEWVYSFLLLAYSPASDADLEAYVAFSETDIGQELNAALFAAFDELTGGISRSLGRLTARYVVTREL